MSFNYDFLKYGTNGLVAVLGIGLYDVIVDGRSVGESFMRNDLLTFGVSNIVTNFSFDVITALIPYINESSVLGMISKPLMGGLIYMILYEYMIGDKYSYNRDEKNNFYVAVILSVILGYVNNPILALLGIRNF